MKNLIVVFTGALLIFASCQKEITTLNENETPTSVSVDLLQGKWSQTKSDNGIHTFKRVNKFDKDSYGLGFETLPTLTEWSFGRCATPPLHFSEFEGIYALQDLTLELTTWGPSIKYKIITCTDSQLILESVD